MLDARNLMRLHVQTLFTADHRGRLLRVNDGSGGRAPRFFLGCTVGGNVWAARHDLDEDSTRELEALAAAEPPCPDAEPNADRVALYIDLLARRQPVERVWTGPTYRFPDSLPRPDGAIEVTPANVEVLRPHLDAWSEDVASGLLVTAALEEGRAVSVCASVRTSVRAEEAGVETHPSFRSRGYAAHAVTAWASRLRTAGRIPLYSTSWENESSRRLARRLGLIQYGSVLHVT